MQHAEYVEAQFFRRLVEFRIGDARRLAVDEMVAARLRFRCGPATLVAAVGDARFGMGPGRCVSGVALARAE